MSSMVYKHRKPYQSFLETFVLLLELDVRQGLLHRSLSAFFAAYKHDLIKRR